jgi:FdhD protein
MATTGDQPIQYIHVDAEGAQPVDSSVIVEQSVALTVNGEVWMEFMCTPIDLEALAIGFLYNERIIDRLSEVVDVRVCEHRDNVDVWLDHAAEKPRSWRRTSGCTGGVTAVLASAEPRISTNGWVITPAQIMRLIDELFDSQKLYRLAGGVHSSCLSDGEQIYVTMEDIGRHNTLDKIAGHCLMEDIRLTNKIMLTTGRISSEMLQKAARLGVAILASRTSPSSLSIALANQVGITLIGYARRNGFNVYSHPQRVLQGQLAALSASS